MQLVGGHWENRASTVFKAGGEPYVRCEWRVREGKGMAVRDQLILETLASMTK